MYHYGIEVYILHIKLYSKIDPRRLSQPVKDLKTVQELLATTGEPLIIEATSKQVAERPIHVHRDATFIGDFVAQIICHGDVNISFIDARLMQPVQSRYTLIMADDFIGTLSIERSKILIEPKSKDVALAGIGSGAKELTIVDSFVRGGIFFVKNLMLKGEVTFDSPQQAGLSCHILDTEVCELTLKQNSLRHDVDIVLLDKLTIDGKCVLSGGFNIKELIVSDSLKSLEMLTITSHFKEPSIVRFGRVVYERGNKNITHIYLNHTESRFLADIDSGINWRVNNSVLQMDDLTDGSKWSLEKDVIVQVSDSARSSLRDLGITQLISKKEFNMRTNGTDDISVFDDPSLTGLGHPDPIEKKATEKIKEMIGQPLVKQQLEDFIAQSEMDKIRVARGLSDGSTITRNMVFAGPPGVGKTEFARLVGQALYENGVLPENKLVEVSAARDLIAGYKGQTAEKTHEVAASAYGGVLFVDEAYALLGDSSEGDFEAKAVQQLLKEAEDHRDELVVILAGYNAQMRQLFEEGNSGLKRRFPYWITFENYTHDEFVDIFKLMLKNSKSTISDSLLQSKPFNDLIDSYAGSDANAGGVRTMLEALILARDSRLRTLGANVSNDDLLRITDKDLVVVYKRRVSDIKKEADAKRNGEVTNA